MNQIYYNLNVDFDLLILKLLYNVNFIFFSICISLRSMCFLNNYIVLNQMMAIVKQIHISFYFKKDRPINLKTE
jgi:hypothetical protein